MHLHLRRDGLHCSPNPIIQASISFDVWPTYLSEARTLTNLGLHVGSTRLLFDHAFNRISTNTSTGISDPFLSPRTSTSTGPTSNSSSGSSRSSRARPRFGHWQARLAWRPPADDGGVPILGYEYRYRKQTDAAYPESWTEVEVDYSGKGKFELKETPDAEQGAGAVGDRTWLGAEPFRHGGPGQDALTAGGTRMGGCWPASTGPCQCPTGMKFVTDVGGPELPRDGTEPPGAAAAALNPRAAAALNLRAAALNPPVTVRRRHLWRNWISPALPDRSRSKPPHGAHRQSVTELRGRFSSYAPV